MYGKRPFAGFRDTTPEKGRILPDNLCVVAANLPGLAGVVHNVIERSLARPELDSHVGRCSGTQAGIGKECEILSRPGTAERPVGIVVLDAAIRPCLRDLCKALIIGQWNQRDGRWWAGKLSHYVVRTGDPGRESGGVSAPDRNLGCTIERRAQSWRWTGWYPSRT